ncbi:relaxase/mobilization nuclease domain-containing protein [Pedobacter nutrimenti]|uniref:relaxase/mobilization nuclease domain-containing protein n=1 Tax=Pedobacter nutrimenti TaxID=1241337 RepID=UPI00292FF7F2|nr:relaxase/mobilization nuclease domain-containing protein [Pedobacter nutrimenti]
MVAILSPGESIRNSFYYNENKVKEGVASLLHAQNYPLKLDELTEKMRLGMLQKLAGLNTRAKVNSLHITLNFDPSESLSKERLIEIADTYMDKIGFGNQPYLIYQHFDAGHPHVHLLTTNIEASGDPISLHHLGIRKSEPARKEIEISYNLVRAESHPKAENVLKPAYNSKVIYGRSDSRRAIANVLNALLKTYHYSSLPELNALLGQYNVRADRGTKDSRVYQNNGLLYRILDDQGKAVGVPLKASAFYNKPTLNALNEQFALGDKAKVPFKKRVKNTIDLALRTPGLDSLARLAEVLKPEGIHTVIRRSEAGIVYGITYVDHKNKCVFNGRDLGTAYSAKGIADRICPLPELAPFAVQQYRSFPLNQVPVPFLPPRWHGPPSVLTTTKDFHGNTQVYNGQSLFWQMMEPEYTTDYVPYEFSGKKKKKKKKKSNNT